MSSRWIAMRKSLVPRVALISSFILLLGMLALAFFTIRYHEAQSRKNATASADLLGSTIRMGTHYAMMLNAREDLNQIIRKMGQQEEIVQLRIVSKSGEIKFSKNEAEIGTIIPDQAPECQVCHRMTPPLSAVPPTDRTRLLRTAEGHRRVGIISPIYNEPSCASEACHVHPSTTEVLGILDVVVSMREAERIFGFFKSMTFVVMLTAFIATAAVLCILINRLVKQPIQRLIEGTRRISTGDYSGRIEINSSQEMGQLAEAVNRMGQEIGLKQAELNRERNKYEELFEGVPCLITVQDRDYRLTSYNRNFAALFDPRTGDYCYRAYKGRDSKCENCPVEKTFLDGRPHLSEESGTNKDGTLSHWIVTTSPIRNDNGEVVAAMELSLDISKPKQLEKLLLETEQRYHAIFDNIPNPVFVLDAEELTILDCNEAVAEIYGFSRTETTGRRFLDFFNGEEQTEWARRLRTSHVLYQARQQDRDGHPLYVNISISPMDYAGREVLLVTTSDITKQVEFQQQLVQAGKMATLGEMATGVAHELNQPLSVIKTASSYFMRKITRREPIPEDILLGMAQEIDSHVNRATRIINHMREFGRKPVLTSEKVSLNHVIRQAYEIFSQQLKVRGIATRWHLSENLPPVIAESGRLEQVFINLLINARDAIEEHWESEAPTHAEKAITLTTAMEDDQALARIEDTGAGIPIHLRDKIFEPFFTTKKVGQGTGLGLSISYGIIKDFNGSIRARTTLEGGACIEVRLPLAGGEA